MCIHSNIALHTDIQQLLERDTDFSLIFLKRLTNSFSKQQLGYRKQELNNVISKIETEIFETVMNVN